MTIKFLKTYRHSSYTWGHSWRVNRTFTDCNLFNFKKLYLSMQQDHRQLKMNFGSIKKTIISENLVSSAVAWLEAECIKNFQKFYCILFFFLSKTLFNITSRQMLKGRFHEHRSNWRYTLPSNALNLKSNATFPIIWLTFNC